MRVREAEPECKSENGGVGTSLVKALAKQLDATAEIKDDSEGTATTITHASFKFKPLKAAWIMHVTAPVVTFLQSSQSASSLNASNRSLTMA